LAVWGGGEWRTKHEVQTSQELTSCLESVKCVVRGRVFCALGTAYDR